MNIVEKPLCDLIDEIDRQNSCPQCGEDVAIHWDDPQDYFEICTRPARWVCEKCNHTWTNSNDS